jgi:hypothetical protein
MGGTYQLGNGGVVALRNRPLVSRNRGLLAFLLTLSIEFLAAFSLFVHVV